MSRRKIWIALGVVLALSISAMLVRTRNDPGWTALLLYTRSKCIVAALVD